MGTMKLKNIKKDYDGIEVLHGIDIDIQDGEFVVFIGESGCGKSTLLRMICGLEDISSGELLIDDKISNDISPQKRNMSMVFQSYALYPHLNVFENIAYGLKIAKVPKDEIEKKVEDATKLLNIDKYLDRLPKNLSGGQRQRVAMGRAIVRDPEFFLFDEPLSNLDAKLRVVMRNEIKSLQVRLKTTTIYVTHDQVEAMTMADKIVLLNEGKVVQIGSPENLYDNPNSVFTASFLGSPHMSFINGTIKIKDKKALFFTKDNIEFPINNIKSLEEGQEVILGIRPQDVHSTNDKKDFKVNINIHEYTGSENIIYGSIGQNNINIAFSRKEKFSKLDDLHISYQVDATHIFCAKTQDVISE